METLQISGAKARQMWLCGTPPPPAATECGGKVDVGGAELTMHGQRDGGGEHTDVALRLDGARAAWV